MTLWFWNIDVSDLV